jgi:hypothetical protein
MMVRPIEKLSTPSSSPGQKTPPKFGITAAFQDKAASLPLFIGKVQEVLQ